MTMTEGDYTTYSAHELREELDRLTLVERRMDNPASISLIREQQTIVLFHLNEYEGNTLQCLTSIMGNC